MDKQAHYLDKDGQARPERRVHDRLREVFPAARELVGPMLAPGKPVSQFALGRAIHDRFGELDPLEVDMLVSAILRLHREGLLTSG